MNKIVTDFDFFINGVVSLIIDLFSSLVVLLVESSLEPYLSKISIYPTFSLIIWSGLGLWGVASLLSIAIGIIEFVLDLL